MAGKSVLMIYKQEFPETRMCYRIVETYWSIDGPRSRITNNVFETREQAEAYISNFTKADPQWVG